MPDAAPTPAPRARRPGRRVLRTTALLTGLALAAYGAALGYLRLNERAYLFLRRIGTCRCRQRGYALREERVAYPSSGGVTIAAWVVPARASVASGLWMLVCHGNYGSIGFGARPPFYAGMRDQGVHLLAFDYRGFGESDGTPEEQGLYDDAMASYTYLTVRAASPPDRIVIFGHSLGSGVAIELASRVPAAALVVEGAYTSVVDRAQELYPLFPVRLIATQRFPSIDRIGSIACPSFFCTRLRTQSSPIAQGRRLFAAAPEPKRFVEVKGGHDNAFRIDGRVYYGAIGELLRTVVPPPSGATRAAPENVTAGRSAR